MSSRARGYVARAMSPYLAFLGLWYVADQVASDATAVQIAATWLVMKLAPTWPFASLAAAVCFDGRKRAAALIPVVVIGLAHVPYLRPNFHQPATEPDLRVMTFNILNQNSDFESVAQLIERYEPDVVALQEVTEEAETALTEPFGGVVSARCSWRAKPGWNDGRPINASL